MENKKEEFQDMVERYGATIARLCNVYADDDDEAADMRQDTLINLWRGWNGFRGDAQLSTWIHRVCINTCISFIRKDSKRPGKKRKGEESDIPEQMEQADERQEMLRELNGLIKKLKTRERALILLWLEDFSYDDIADVMGLNRNTVATLLRRTKQKLIELKNNQ